MPPDPELFDQDPADATTATSTPLAIPCGFSNINNAPCQRLASTSVLLDGVPFLHQNRPLLHCPRRCFLEEWPSPDPDYPF